MSSVRVLRTFLAVARHGSFAAAGKRIGLTEAAVGMQMRALEEDLKRTLFDRNGRSVVLNTSGRAAIQPIADLVVRYEALGSPAQGGLSGSVVVGALVSALMGAFADALWAIKREHPHLEVRLRAGLSSDFASMVEQGELDAAIVTQPPHALPLSVKWTALYSEPMILIVPRRPHFPMASNPVEVLGQAPFLRFDRSTWTGHLVDETLARARVVARDGIELDSLEAIIELVRQGFGVSIVPRLDNLRWARDANLRVVRLAGNDVERRVGLLERRQHSRIAFTDAIKRYFAARRRRTPRSRA